MPPLPKKKTSKARHGKRASHLNLTPLPTELCLQCHTLKLCHHVCPNCGSYGGKEVIKVKRAKK